MTIRTIGFIYFTCARCIQNFCCFFNNSWNVHPSRFRKMLQIANETDECINDKTIKILINNSPSIVIAGNRITRPEIRRMAIRRGDRIFEAGSRGISEWTR